IIAPPPRVVKPSPACPRYNAWSPTTKPRPRSTGEGCPRGGPGWYEQELPGIPFFAEPLRHEIDRRPQPRRCLPERLLVERAEQPAPLPPGPARRPRGLPDPAHRLRGDPDLFRRRAAPRAVRVVDAARHARRHPGRDRHRARPCQPRAHRAAHLL